MEIVGVLYYLGKIARHTLSRKSNRMNSAMHADGCGCCASVCVCFFLRVRVCARCTTAHRRAFLSLILGTMGMRLMRPQKMAFDFSTFRSCLRLINDDLWTHKSKVTGTGCAYNVCWDTFLVNFGPMPLKCNGCRRMASCGGACVCTCVSVYIIYVIHMKFIHAHFC